MTSLYAPDPALEELLEIKHFEDNFDVLEFITAISDKLITQSKDDNGPFDPAPFIRTFEHSVERLLEIRKDVQERKESLENSLRSAERDFSRRLTQLNTGFEDVNKTFNKMESSIGQVGKSAVRIGEQLESIHVSRQRAQAAHDLIDYYNQFSKGDTQRLDSLRKDGGKAGRRQVATTLRRLLTVAKEVDLPDAEQTRERIDKYCEQFEKDMLRLFDKSYRKGDPNMMGHCAQTLIDFNGGASCVQIYVNQHDFFISKAQMAEMGTLETSEMWSSLEDPNAPVPKDEPGLTKLFGEIRYTVDQEYRIIQAVFPNPPVVMQVFLQRVFAQSIQPYLEQLLSQAQSQSTLSYLRVLQLAHVSTHKLVEDLKAYDFSTTVTRPADARSLELANATSSNPTVAIATMLETAMEELFLPYSEGVKYIEKETRMLGELYSQSLERFNKFHEFAMKAKSTNLFDRLALLTGASPATTATAASAGAAASAAASAAFMNISGRIRGAAGVTAPAAPVQPAIAEKDKVDLPTEEEGRLSIDVAERLLTWHAEAVGRCVELSAPSDMPKNISALMKVLEDTIAKGYIECSIESATTLMESRDTRLEPDLQPIRTLKEIDMICHLWQQYTSIALLPLANTSVTVRREMSIFHNQTLSRVEGGSSGMLQRVTDAIIAWLGSQLTKQKKNDFKPKNDDLAFSRMNTEPCETCCEMLDKVRDVAKENMSGKNLEMFLTTIGVAFHTLLLDHLKKFPVSANGGLVLTKDLKSYQDTVVSFGYPALSERFEFLRQLGNIFLIQPDILKSYITENYLGRIEPGLLKPYLAQRSDWAQFERDFDFRTPMESVANTEPGTPSATSGSTSFTDSAGVSTTGMMMRDLENVRIGGPTGIPLLASASNGSGTFSGRSGHGRNRFSLSGFGFQNSHGAAGGSSSLAPPASTTSVNGNTGTAH
ncbi:exocyst complex component Sec10 [Clavulina sp. PMI_390]|nr:exocyst complex component Sec10 [Clavulina sp. PMI_390]